MLRGVSMYGRDEAEWIQLTEWGRPFLTEVAASVKPISYSDLHAALVQDTALRGFDFDQPGGRAAMGYLLKRCQAGPKTSPASCT